MLIDDEAQRNTCNRDLCFDLVINPAKRVLKNIDTVRTKVALCNMIGLLSDIPKLSKLQPSSLLLGREKFSCTGKERKDGKFSNL